MFINDIRRSMPIHPSRNYPQRLLSDIDKVIIHHSGTTSGSSRSYAEYHINNNNWPGIAYHYVISKSGQIELTTGLDKVGWHAGNAQANATSIGICLTGDYMQQVPPPAQIDALVWLIKELQRRFVPLQIGAHRDYANRTCPGDNIDTEDIRRRAAGFTQPPLIPSMGANPAAILSLGLLALIWNMTRS